MPPSEPISSTYRMARCNEPFRGQTEKSIGLAVPKPISSFSLR
jgi:hypothetical protein